METTSALAGAPAADSLIEAVVAGRYRIEERIGEGQMARVYRARHVRLSRSFAVKVLPGSRASDPLMRLRFAQEAEAASRLDHPNVVSVVDFGRIESGELYLVMALVDGEPLTRLIAREAPLAPPRAIALARALARGLGHAHERGLVHRDFKPDNIVLEEAAVGPPLPRILDFGLAIEADPDGPRLTEQGFVVGTPIYLAPEQACGEPVDSRADLYALGVVLYEMLAGRPPFEGDAIEVARRKLVELPPPIGRRNPDVAVPPGLEAVVLRLLEQYPGDRFESAADLVAALDEVEQGRTAPPPPPPPPPTRAESAPTRADPLPPRAQPLPPRAQPLPPRAQPLPPRAEPLPPRAEPPVRSWPWRRVAIAAAALALFPVVGSVSMRATGAPDEPRPAVPAPPAATPQLEPEAAPAAALSAATVREAPEPPAAEAAQRPRPRQPAAASADDEDLARLAREYREVGEALGRLHETRGAEVARPLEARYLRISYADSLRVRSLRRETLARLAALRRAIRAADPAPQAPGRPRP